MSRNPADVTTFASPLGGLRIGISGAIPEREHWGDVTDLDQLILAFVSQLTALLVRYGGQVVHGSHPIIAPVIIEQVRGQCREGTEPLKLFASQLFGGLKESTLREVRNAQGLVVMTEKVGAGDAGDRETRNKSLTAMRLAMTQDIDVLIAIGGKLHRTTGFNPGVLEELALARWHTVPNFVVGAFGGVAGDMDRELLDELCGGNLLDGSSVTAVDLATCTDTMDIYVGKLLVHLAQHQKEFKRPELPMNRQLLFYSGGESGLSAGDPTAVRVIGVNAQLVDTYTEKFKNLKEAIDARNMDRARLVLRGQIAGATDDEIAAVPG
jgi:SLOG cluster2